MPYTDVDKFLNERASKSTKLQTWESQIFELLAKKAAYSTMKDYLETKNVTVSSRAIQAFVKAQKRSDLYEKAMQQRKNPG